MITFLLLATMSSGDVSVVDYDLTGEDCLGALVEMEDAQREGRIPPEVTYSCEVDHNQPTLEVESTVDVEPLPMWICDPLFNVHQQVSDRGYTGEARSLWQSISAICGDF